MIVDFRVFPARRKASFYFIKVDPIHTTTCSKVMVYHMQGVPELTMKSALKSTTVRKPQRLCGTDRSKHGETEDYTSIGTDGMFRFGDHSRTVQRYCRNADRLIEHRFVVEGCTFGQIQGRKYLNQRCRTGGHR